MQYTTDNLMELCWPGNRVGEAIEWLAYANGLISTPVASGTNQKAGVNQVDENNWQTLIDRVATALGIEAEPVSCPYGKLQSFFQFAAPAIVKMPTKSESAPAFFLVFQKKGRHCRVLKPDLQIVTISAEIVADAFRKPLSAAYREPAEQLLSLANIAGERKDRVADALIGSWLGAEIIPVGWLLRSSPGSNLKIQIKQSSLVQEILGWLAAFALQDILYLLAWWLIGRVVLDGQTDRGWVWAWVLLLVSAIPFQLTASWMQNRFAESLGVIFKQRLLFSALKMNPDDIRHLGTGQLLERVMEAESVEMLALGGGLTAIISIFQLGVAAWVLSQGAGGLLSMAVLALWLTAMLIAGWINYNSGKQWTDTYRSMTNGLVEKMVGHRTRLAQEDPDHRHDEEDIELDHYQTLTRSFSKTGLLLGAIPASWLVAGLACFIPALISKQSAQLPSMAVGLGGVMLAYQAFGIIQAGIQNDILLLLSWQQVKPIYQAGSTEEIIPTVMLKTASLPNRENPAQLRPTIDKKIPLITAHDLSYRFAPHRRPALHDCALKIYPGDRIILEGPSGGGKTTLGAVLAGIRKPDSGLLFLYGYDWQSLGEATWRKRVVMAPQFHENHIFNETFAFNLLMGRRWPPQLEDMQAAETICQELGLGDLLARMPSGWQQMVGESGWQLSHGERSRVFIARALLQNADLVIMDESFGALDPENLYLALECAQRRAATLLIIAHP